MISCLQTRGLVPLYVDGELAAAEVLEVEAHLTDCGECRSEFERLRDVVDAVRGSSPLYDAPAGSYERVERLVSTHDSRAWLPIAAAAAVLLVVLASWISTRQREARSAYASFAAQTHLSYARGTFPLDFASSEPRQVAKWLEPRVPFHIPDSPRNDGELNRYALTGARLMQYAGHDVAYLAYTMDSKPISLMIASSSDEIVPSGSETYQSRGLTFHFAEQHGLRIITWTDRGLTYAQVSDLRVRGADSCAICHGSAEERPKFENLQRYFPVF